MENKGLAEKLRNPEAYYKKWNKTSRTQLENQLNKNKRESLLNSWLRNKKFFFNYLSY